MYLTKRGSTDIGAKTLAATDCGVIQNLTSSATITLPSTAAGLSFTIRNGGDNAANTPAGAVSDGTVTITIDPAAADKITGNGFTAADNKDIVNTLGKVGDYVTLVGDGVDGWVIQEIAGTWTRQA